MLAPKAHLFVCANRRRADDPLGPGCGDRGDAVYAALKAEVAQRGLHREAWVTKTACLGVCPKSGCTVAAYPEQTIASEIDEAGALSLLSAALASQSAESLVAEMEELQMKKVFDLARRLKPGLTLEDMRNPHDFPELNDADWHYEDGILTGIQSVSSALRARKAR